MSHKNESEVFDEQETKTTELHKRVQTRCRQTGVSEIIAPSIHNSPNSLKLLTFKV